MKQQIPQLMQQATRALNQGAYKELHQLCQQILKLDQQQADAWFFMSIVAEAGRQVSKAIQFVHRALDIDSGNSEYLSQKAKLHTLLNQYPQALAAADQAFAAAPDSAIVLDTLGVVYSKLGEFEKARDVLLETVKRNPGNPQYQFNLASAEQFLGNADAAQLAYEDAIKLQPNFARAHWALSELEKNQTDTKRFDKLLQLVEQPELSSEDELYLAHAISREYEKMQDYKNAFAYLEKGKQRRKATVKYSPVVDEQLFSAIRQAFANGDSVRDATEALGDQCIFIVGMPRSGTTLVERILNSHSCINSLGELQEFARAVKAVSNTSSPTVLDAEVIASASAQDMTAIGRTYLQMLGERLQPGKPYIDKMPLNFLCVGFIMHALPKAKVICLRRNALDTCLSNYRQLFALNFSYYNYHYDLADTAHYFCQFESLMSHWQSIYGERFHQVSYEALTGDPESHVRSLLDYLGLDWEPACLEFHNSTDAVATASAMQVRQPLYTSAVGRWKKYEDQLQPAIRVLEQANIPFQQD